MKKVLCLLMVLLLVMPMAFVGCNNKTKGLDFHSNGDGTCTVSPADSKKIRGEIVIPEISPDGDRVTRIGGFSQCEDLTSITLPQSITQIGEHAFSRCSGLTSIIIPESVTYIGENAFSNCTGLTSISIPNSVTFIGPKAFMGCIGLTSITVEKENSRYHSVNNCIVETQTNTLISGCGNSVIPEYITRIDECAFARFTNLASISIPKNVTSIGYDAFDSCDAVIRNMNGVHYVDNWVVGCDDDLRSGSYNISIDLSGAIGIADEVFSDCHNLVDVVIPSSVEHMGESVFGGCSNLANVTLSEGIKNISNGTFKNCSSLISITIPEGVESIGSEGFSGCTGLVNITIPDSVIDIDSSAFHGCEAVMREKNGIIYIDRWVYSWKDNVSSFDLTGVKGLLDNAFEGCLNLSDIVIPDSVVSIGEGVFEGCTGLESIRVAQGNTRYHSIDNCVIETATGVLVAGCKNSTIPDGITSIANRAFCLQSELENVAIPDSVISIGDAAFSSCEGLTNITIPNGVESIGNEAFYSCVGLSSITIPDSVTGIGDAAFAYCEGLESIVVSKGNQTYYSVDNCLIETDTNTLLAGCNNSMIPQGVTSIADYAFSDCTGLTSIIIPEGVTSIGGFAFSGCTGLTSAVIPDSVMSIGKFAFINCSSLTSIIIPEGVTSIEPNTFARCLELASVTLPVSVKEIKKGAFGCRKLTDVYYYGSEEEWGKISIDLHNFSDDVTIHYNYVPKK